MMNDARWKVDVDIDIVSKSKYVDIGEEEVVGKTFFR